MLKDFSQVNVMEPGKQYNKQHVLKYRNYYESFTIVKYSSMT